MALFYVIYLRDGISVDCIEAIRLLSNPFEKKAAHLTVRGPFPNKIRLEDANKKLAGNKILLDGISRFLSPNQYTIFFTCKATRIKKVWNKPDYPFNPHVTIYDGDSLMFASELYDVLSRHSYKLGFLADKLTPLISKSGTKNQYKPLHLDVVEISKIIGEPFDISRLSEMNGSKRLALIEQLCRFLEQRSLETDPNFLFTESTKRKAKKSMLDSLRHGILSWT